MRFCNDNTNNSSKMASAGDYQLFLAGGRNYPEQITDEFLTCYVCKEPGFHSKPKLLSCGHTFCQSCLEPRVTDGAWLRCPRCCAVTTLRAGGVAALRTHLFFDTQIDRLLRRHNKERGRDDTWYNIGGYSQFVDGHAHFK